MGVTTKLLDRNTFRWSIPISEALDWQLTGEALRQALIDDALTMAPDYITDSEEPSTLEWRDDRFIVTCYAAPFTRDEVQQMIYTLSGDVPEEVKQDELESVRLTLQAWLERMNETTL